MRLSDFDFDLPEDRIALRPARPRDSARLLLVPAGEGVFEDHGVRDLPGLLRPGDLLVFNDTRTLPAALKAVRGPRGAGDPPVQIGLNLIRRAGPDAWEALARPARRLRPGDALAFAGALAAQVIARDAGGSVTLRFDRAGAALDAAIGAAGSMPLPPYIARRREADGQDASDYQTIYARADGSVATPTAGLHFTDGLLAALDARGVRRTWLTLHVGAGTFLPVKTDNPDEHVMHSETYEVSPETVAAIHETRAAGGRVIAVGTTSLRTLETITTADGRAQAGAGDTSIFIRPGHQFRLADGLMTNFHLPKSTLMMLVSAFSGTERMRAAYAHAIAQGYRFFSYGDASLLWRGPGA